MAALTPLCPAEPTGTGTPGHTATVLPHLDVLRVPREQQSRSCPVLAAAPWGHSRALSHPAGGQYPNCPGYESAPQERSSRAGTSGAAPEVPRQPGCAPAKFRAGWRAGHRRHPPGSAATSRAPPGTAKPRRGIPLPVCTALLPGAEPWPCLTLTRPGGPARLSPRAPGTGMFHRAGQSIPAGRACP